MVRLVALCLVGCAYTPGSFRYNQQAFAGEYVTAGCFDLAIERRPDHEGAAVIAYRFGNRCDSRQTIDFARVRVIGRDVDGDELELVPFDPQQEIRPLSIDARLVGRETLAYHAPRVLGQVCVDAASFANRHPAVWKCFTPVVAKPAEEPAGSQEPETPTERPENPTGEGNDVSPSDERKEVP